MCSVSRLTHQLEDGIDLPVEKLSKMTPEREHRFWEQFKRALDSDTGEATRERSAAGRPIYDGDSASPCYVVKRLHISSTGT